MDKARKTEQEQAAFFAQALQAAQQAERATDAITVRLDVAETRVDLVFAGDALARLILPALNHLRTESEAAAIATIHVWDSASTGVPMPPPPCPRGHFTDRGDIWGFVSDRYRTAFHWVEFSVNCFDRESGVGSFWVEKADGLPYWTKASPLRTMLHWILELQGVQLMHAAAVGTADGAVLITGKGGVGKSSTALSSLVHGLSYAADDYLAVRLEPEPVVYSLYSTAKLNAEDVSIYPALAEHVTNMSSMHGEKAVLHLYPVLAQQILRKMRLRAVLTPRVAAQTDTQIVPADKQRLRRAAAFTTLSQLPYAGQQTQDFIVRMVDKLPGFEIMLGSDRRGNVAAIQNLLTQPDARLAQLAAEGRRSDEHADLPLVTVIIPVFNGARFLPDAIQNVLAQRYPNLEIIVVDDGSTEPLESAVSKLPVDVRLFRQENAGPAAARNRGIRDASGQFIAFLDVDDLWPEGSLHNLVRTLIANPELVVVHGHAQLLTLDEATQVFNPEGNPAESFPYYIGAGLYRREAFQVIGLFDGSMWFAEDTDWYTRLRESGLKHERVAQVTLQVRRHGGNMTATKTPEELRATSLHAFRKALQRAKQKNQTGT
jgi:GT2 family glycosyltransferase